MRCNLSKAGEVNQFIANLYSNQQTCFLVAFVIEMKCSTSFEVNIKDVQSCLLRSTSRKTTNWPDTDDLAATFLLSSSSCASFESPSADSFSVSYQANEHHIASRADKGLNTVQYWDKQWIESTTKPTGEINNSIRLYPISLSANNLTVISLYHIL